MNPDTFIPTRESLLGRLRNWDDHKSWQDFFHTYARLIRSVARKAGLTDSEAEEVLQETLIAVAKKMPEFRYDPAVDSFKGWLLALTKLRIADQFRKRDAKGTQNLPTSAATGEDGTRTATIERIPDPGGFNFETAWDEEWRASLRRQALEKLKRRVSAEQYQIFHLHILKEQPAAEVCRALQVSLNRVYLAKYRVGKLLRQEIKQLEAELR